MISKYRVLFQVSLLHDYFIDGKCDGIEIRPSPATSGLLARSRLLFKGGGNELRVLTQGDEPALRLDEPFVFYLALASAEFLTLTNVAASAGRPQRHYFTNLAQNLAGSAVLNLTRPVQAFAGTRAYRPGELVSTGTPATVFECIKAGQGQDPRLADSAFWVSRGVLQYASSEDVLPVLPRIANFTLQTAAHAFRVKVFALDVATNAYDRLVREEVVAGSAVEVSTDVQVNLEGLRPGRYRLDVNGEPFDAYFDDEAATPNVFGVMEIFPHLPSTSPFSFLNAAGVVRDTSYVVRFANRLAFWKYVTPRNKVDGILLSGAHDQPSPFTSGSNDPAQPALKDFFVSKRPLPLSEAPTQNLFDLMIGSEPKPAPKPDPKHPGMLTQAFDATTKAPLDSLCTIRLNY